MKFRVSLSTISGKSSLRFDFEPETDDRTEGTSMNSKKSEVRLAATRCTFEFPFAIEMPHPDLCAFAAVKISAPFIGRRLEMDRPVSRRMADAILAEYSNITQVNFSEKQAARERPESGPVGLAFSGGADSMAAAYILPRGTLLISLVRKQHPDTGPIETWHNGNEVGDVLAGMPSEMSKIAVHTDFPYTCLDANGRFVVWADRMWHSVPAVLLAQHFKLSGISQGNIMAAFMADERKFAAPRIKKHHLTLLGALGLSSVQPLAGSSEFISEAIVRHHGHQGATLTCNFGQFKRPCMACVKCLRKSLINHILDGTTPTESEIARFNSSKRIAVLADKRFIPLTATLKYIFENIGIEFDGNVGEIKRKVMQSYPGNPSWVRSIYHPFYEGSPENQEFLRQLSIYADRMSDDQLVTLRQLNIS